MCRRSTALWLLSGCSLLAGVAAGADPLYESANAKLDSIVNGKVAPGAQVLFPVDEINAWASVKAREKVGDGVRDLHVKLQAGAGTGAALVDFLKIQQARGKPPSALMARILEGEHLLKADVRVVSEGGRCTVYLAQVDMSGTVVSGALLDYLIKTFLLPLYPDAKIGEPFDLPSNIERIELLPEGVRVRMQR